MGWKVFLTCILILGISLLVLFIYGSKSWETYTKNIHDRLDSAGSDIKVKVYHSEEINNLPLPVQRYFRKVLKDGQRIISAAKFNHTGTFNMSQTDEQWKPFTSTQRVMTNRPGFDWEARVSMMPGIAVKVHDAYIGGEGLLQVSVLGFDRLVDMHGTPEMAQGELMRYFAESVWYPTALLPSQGVSWEPVNDTSARATLKDGKTSVSLLFNFNSKGLIKSVETKSRMRLVGDSIVATPWECRLKNYELKNEMRVPMEGEVSWILPKGPLPYWRGQITEIDYHFAQ